MTDKPDNILWMLTRSFGRMRMALVEIAGASRFPASDETTDAIRRMADYGLDPDISCEAMKRWADGGCKGEISDD